MLENCKQVGAQIVKNKSFFISVGKKKTEWKLLPDDDGKEWLNYVKKRRIEVDADSDVMGRRRKMEKRFSVM